MRILLIISIFSIVGCSYRSEQSDSKKDLVNLKYSGNLLPSLLANEKVIWDSEHRKYKDTLKHATYNFTFKMLNYHRFTDKSLDNPLEGIKNIEFRLRATGLDITLKPIIKDSIGLLVLNMDTITVSSFKYHVDMKLKFKKTDSTFAYRGVIYLEE